MVLNLSQNYKSMKKLLYILIISIAAFSCSKSGLEIESGNVVGEIEVTAFAGQMTVSVETVGRWIVSEADNASWISFDVQGGVGKGAFTVSYEANMSSVVDMKSSRKARIVVTSEDYAKSDTLNIIQQGFYSDIKPSVVNPSAEIVLEYVESSAKTLSVVYCSADGVSDLDALNEWAQQFDVVACGNGFLKPSVESTGIYAQCTVDDINIVSTDLAPYQEEGNGFEVFKEIVDATYNAYNSPSKWIIGGQLYHYSMMQVGYAQTPSWFPSEIDAPEFQADSYAWNNNLYDSLWMSQRDYISTWEDDSKAYMADYVYVSRDVLATVCQVEKLEKVHGMTHNPVKVTLKY